MADKLPKVKSIPYSAIPLLDEHRDQSEPYKLKEEIVREHCQNLLLCNIVLAWRYDWARSVDGKLTLGQCCKVSDLDKELADKDFIILLNYEAWQTLDSRQRLAVLHHELLHCAPSIDKDSSEQIEDERGRLVWRVRKHDIEEFSDVVRLYGCYKSDLESFAKAMLGKSTPTLFDPAGDGEQQAV